MMEPKATPRQTAGLHGAQRVGAALSYLLLALAVVAVALTIAAAAGGLAGWAVTAGAAAAVLAVAGVVLWRRQANRKWQTHVDSHDRATNTEGKGPLGV